VKAYYCLQLKTCKITADQSWYLKLLRIRTLPLRPSCHCHWAFLRHSNWSTTLNPGVGAFDSNCAQILQVPRCFSYWNLTCSSVVFPIWTEIRVLSGLLTILLISFQKLKRNTLYISDPNSYFSWHLKNTFIPHESLLTQLETWQDAGTRGVLDPSCTCWLRQEADPSATQCVVLEPAWLRFKCVPPHVCAGSLVPSVVMGPLRGGSSARWLGQGSIILEGPILLGPQLAPSRVGCYRTTLAFLVPGFLSCCVISVSCKGLLPWCRLPSCDATKGPHNLGLSAPKL
jgi:hypothetical protein